MKTKVTKRGVVIPKEFFDDVMEVDIRQEPDRIVVVPIMLADPILGFGENPVACGVSDAAEHHDKYLYQTHHENMLSRYGIPDCLRSRR